MSSDKSKHLRQWRRLSDAFARGLSPKFPGEIYEWAERIELRNGYAVKGRFDINRSNYMREPFHALRKQAVRRVVIQKAVQTGGTLIADMWLPYLICQYPGETLWILQDDDMAKKYCEARLMPLLEGIPDVQKKLPKDRFAKQRTAIFFPHMSLILGGANEGNVQTLSKQYVICDEVWLYPPGIVRQAKKRTEAYPNSSKILLIGQAGEVGDDMDLEWTSTNMAEWNWPCPHCAKLNPYRWTVKRADGSYAGMIWDRNETTCPDGRWNIHAAAKTARMVCEHCGGDVPDKPELRRQLDRNGVYVPANPGAPADSVGFHWPAWACPDISFGKLVAEYLSAKEQDDLHGYKLPLMEFRQKVEALPWDPNTDTEMIRIVSEHYDPSAAWPEERFRFLTVDCQKDFKEFWWVVRAWASSGESRQIARGRADTWEGVAEIQRQYSVRDNNVFVDCGYEQTKVAQECVKRGSWMQVPGGRTRVSWIALKGVRQETFTHSLKGRQEKRVYSELDYLNPMIGQAQGGMRCPFFSWSNLNVKDILRRHRDGDASKFLSLPDEAPPGDQWSYTAQMNSEMREKQTDERGKKISIWRPIGRRPNHYWDCEAMQIVAALIAQVIGGQVVSIAASGATD